jgi:alkanesulfonate monooxygenase SsuD/methylene tetrahydromethanopterin reductase-like flavin-dependent oxidoreductase (luciferase family)
MSRNPLDNSRTKDRPDYWIWLAKTAERGKISTIFFADSYGELDIYEGKADAQYRAGNFVGRLDPAIVVPIMASVTKSLGFGVTGSTSYITPYHLARNWSTLDHITSGRVGMISFWLGRAILIS